MLTWVLKFVIQCLIEDNLLYFAQSNLTVKCKLTSFASLQSNEQYKSTLSSKVKT